MNGVQKCEYTYFSSPFLYSQRFFPYRGGFNTNALDPNSEQAFVKDTSSYTTPICVQYSHKIHRIEISYTGNLLCD